MTGNVNSGKRSTLSRGRVGYFFWLNRARIDQAPGTRPDWFRVLQGVSSGQARAELLRAHLAPPSENYIFEIRRREEARETASPVHPKNANSPIVSTGIPGRSDTPEKFSGAQSEEPGNPASERNENANSPIVSTGIPGRSDTPEKFSGAPVDDPGADDDADTESLAELLVRTRDGMM